MKVRSPFTCERCKRYRSTGTIAIRFHGRLWCLECTTDYLAERKAKQVA